MTALSLRSEGRPLRIGHRGAAALAPENTLASLRAAVEAGVDLVELDVLRLPDGRLALAHSLEEAPAAPTTFDDALAYLRETGCGAHVDVKAVREEEAIVAALCRHGLEERAVVSTARADVLRRFAALAPELPRALTYPEDRLGIGGERWAAPAVAVGLAALRRLLPLRIGGMLSGAGATVASLNERVVTAAVVARCRALGVPVLAWTVNDAKRVAGLAALGVDGIVTDDPRLFEATLPA